MPQMKKNKHTNIGYFFGAQETFRNKQTQIKKKNHPKTKTPKPNNNSLYFRHPYFKIATIEDHISDVLLHELK